MKTVSPKSKKASRAKSKVQKKADSLLSVCPVDGAGWCPYPFSPTQLKKRLKRLEMIADFSATEASD